MGEDVGVRWTASRAPLVGNQDSPRPLARAAGRPGLARQKPPYIGKEEHEKNGPAEINRKGVSPAGLAGGGLCRCAGGRRSGNAVRVGLLETSRILVRSKRPSPSFVCRIRFRESSGRKRDFIKIMRRTSQRFYENDLANVKFGSTQPAPAPSRQRSRKRKRGIAGWPLLDAGPPFLPSSTEARP